MRSGHTDFGAGLRVVIADDHAFYRDALVRLLESQGMTVVAEAANGGAAIRAVEATAPDVAVMDLNMPGLSGLAATRILVERAPSTRVLILTVSAQESDVADAMLAGASGYVLKDGLPEEIIGSIQGVAAGHELISPRVAAMLLRRLGDLRRDRELAGAGLSPRELEVLVLLAEGVPDGDVAEQAGLSLAALPDELSRILLKLRVAVRVRAAALVPGDRRQGRSRISTSGGWSTTPD